jgi:hypothetical protein
MDISEVWDRLLAARVAVWLDDVGNLRIDKEAPAELKELAREHKPEILAVLKANQVMNRSGMRIVRLPLGGFALAKPPSPLPQEVVDAIRALRMDHLPVVLQGESGLPYREWVRRQVLDFSKPLCDPEELERWRREREAEEEARLRSRRRRTA